MILRHKLLSTAFLEIAQTAYRGSTDYLHVILVPDVYSLAHICR